MARAIDLRLAEELLDSARRTSFRHKSRVPEGAGMTQPLRLSWPAQAVCLGASMTAAEVEIAVYDLGSLCITWSIDFDGSLQELAGLSASLYEHVELTASSHAIAAEVVAGLGAAVLEPRSSEHVEDYVIYQVEPVEGGVQQLLEGSRAQLAQVLRAEVNGLSAQEIEDALANPVSYGEQDVCLIDWISAFLMGRDMKDERFVLELATVELLAMRQLDFQLDQEIDEAHELLTRPRKTWRVLTGQRRELEQVARMQADGAFLHEGIDNALKLFGDDYLARLYRTAGVRYHFGDWDHSIQHKLDVLRSVYQSLADSAAHRRAELLEWIIIVLIAVDIVLYFTPLR
ncbi:MAG TPA: hypothetical protein VGC54_11120 [Planctomycetota bacterium]